MPTNLGMFGIQSCHGAFLQAHSDNGQMHASNDHRNTEETWFIINLDDGQKTVAIQNWDNGKYLSKQSNTCVTATATVIGPNECWHIEDGAPYGVHNADILRCAADRTIIGTNAPGDNDPGGCGGEVTCRDNWGPGGLQIPMNQGMWGGWWVITPATTPDRGSDLWTGIWKTLNGISANINPGDMAAIVGLLI